ncbi:RNA polymerase sigma-I factor [Paenibacillus thermoaerophilus]|uniref:RNA polymerase sigma factor SigI n=1 Tax=Paenibacillus thermoaerophilus TaxID=1215385 RepID=A0ABW2V3W1_9BACL|nr:RNA polymerase sigma-I factor [Paenibacillus thermoaerophilus]TMV17092.1 RNA polymerase sigma-I factor [Paenibacillus thermoaerophilus]
MDRSIEDILLDIRKGNSRNREWLIEQYRPFILRALRHVCKRKVEWNDDEASIGLIAFNEAINHYDSSHGKTFDNFAFMMIRRRLIDEFRKNGKISKFESLVLNSYDGFEFTASEISSSLEIYAQQESAATLTQELILYDERLQEYGIRLEELEKCSPSHQDARKQLIRIAKRFCENPEMKLYLERTKHLPLKEMTQYAGVSKKTLERNRKYLIALILIFSCDEFVHIRNKVSFSEIGE